MAERSPAEERKGPLRSGGMDGRRLAFHCDLSVGAAQEPPIAGISCKCPVSCACTRPLHWYRGLACKGRVHTERAEGGSDPASAPSCQPSHAPPVHLPCGSLSQTAPLCMLLASHIIEAPAEARRGPWKPGGVTSPPWHELTLPLWRRRRQALLGRARYSCSIECMPVPGNRWQTHGLDRPRKAASSPVVAGGGSCTGASGGDGERK